MLSSKKEVTPRRGRSASRGRTQQKSEATRSKLRGLSKSRSDSRNSKKIEPPSEPRQTRSRSRSIHKSKPTQMTSETVSPLIMPQRETPEVVPSPTVPIPSGAAYQSEVIQNEPIREENGPEKLEKKSESSINGLTLYNILQLRSITVLIIFSLCLWSLTKLAEKGRTDILPSWWFTFKRDNEQNLPDPVSVAISSISVLVAKASWKLLKHYQ